MKVNQSEWISLDEHGVCSAQFLTEVSGLSDDEINELIDNDVIVPVDDSLQPSSFPLFCIATVNRARRLRDDFELDSHGMVLALKLLYRIDALQIELDATRAHIR
jgi:chaperone modulatory protein CbpM